MRPITFCDTDKNTEINVHANSNCHRLGYRDYWPSLGLVHCVQKKNTTHVFFYISVENVSIYTKISGYVYEELSILRT